MRSKRPRQFHSVREWALAKGLSLNSTYRAIYERRLEATKDSNGEWRISADAVIRSRKRIAQQAVSA